VKLSLSPKEVVEFQGSLMIASEDQASSVVDDYAQRLVDRSEPAGTDEPRQRLTLDSARSLMRSLKPVSSEVYCARIDCCAKCEHVRVISGEAGSRRAVYQCGKCRCIMNAKAMLASSKCPDGRF
jgi:hypothetical protein